MYILEQMHKNQTNFFFPQILEFEKNPNNHFAFVFLISHFGKISPLKKYACHCFKIIVGLNIRIIMFFFLGSLHEGRFKASGL
jgi:hypothetical protein